MKNTKDYKLSEQKDEQENLKSLITAENDYLALMEVLATLAAEEPEQPDLF